MSTVAWVTDPHFDMIDDPAERDCFLASVGRSGAGALLIGGDMAEAPGLVRCLEWLDEKVSVPVYFVLGNHDYYRSGVSAVREEVRRTQTETLRWLPDSGVVKLDENTALVGHGGWGDGRIGNFLGGVVVNDYLLIEELAEASDSGGIGADFIDRFGLGKVLEKLGDDAAATLKPHLEEAAKRYSRVIVLTHVSPFRESCWYAGRISDETFLPAFTCKAMGDMIAGIATEHPDSHFVVLCGHTHGSGFARIRPNLEVHTGGAEYGRVFVRAIDLEEDPLAVMDYM